jgi:hypothetical protein
MITCSLFVAWLIVDRSRLPLYPMWTLYLCTQVISQYVRYELGEMIPVLLMAVCIMRIAAAAELARLSSWMWLAMGSGSAAMVLLVYTNDAVAGQQEVLAWIAAVIAVMAWGYRRDHHSLILALHCLSWSLIYSTYRFYEQASTWWNVRTIGACILAATIAFDMWRKRRYAVQARILRGL